MNRWFDYYVGVPLMKVLRPLSKWAREESGPPKRILVIKLAAVGDTVLLIPLLRSLRAAYPDASLHWLVSSINQSIAKTVPYVDRLHAWSPKTIMGLFLLIRNLRKERFDTVIDLEQWSRGSAILSFLTGAQRRVGFDTPGQSRASLYTSAVEKKFNQHEILDFYDVAGLVGPLQRDVRLELWETEQGRLDVQTRLSLEKKGNTSSKKILIHPGCGEDGLPREWPLPSYGVLGHWLVKNFKADLFLTSGPEEKKKTAQLKQLLNGQARDWGGKLTWDGMISLVNQVDLVISGNTGIMHIAAALQKPQVALHGPTNQKLWGPLNSRAIVLQSSCPQCPCLRLGFEYHTRDQSCMKRIDVEDVKLAVQRLFDSPPRIL